MAKLTHMQQKVYDYIVSCIQTQGYPPSVREIGAAVGLKSPSTVHFHMKKLEAEGHILKADGKTYLCFDLVQQGLGCINSWGYTPLPQYMVDYKDYTFNFIISPIR